VNTGKVSYTLSEAIASGSVTWTRTGGTADATSPHVQALSGTELNTGAHSNITLSSPPSLTSGTIYTISFDATDAAGNTATAVSNTGVTFDNTAPVISATAPATSAFVNTGKVSYTLSEAIASGSVTWTRTGGTADATSPHVQALSGTELNTGAHSNITLNSPPSLTSGTIYTVSFDATDAAGNTATTVSNTGVTFDNTAPVISATAPATSAFVNTGKVSYTLSEAIASGSVTWTATGGTADATSPHVQALSGTELNTGAHSNITLNSPPNLTSGTIYTISFDATDAAGNIATTVSNTSVTFDNTAPDVAVTLVSASPSTLSSLAFTVTFSESVTGVDVTDFVLATGTANDALGTIGLTGSGAVYTVTVGSIVADYTNSTQAILNLDIVGSPGIADAAGNAFSGTVLPDNQYLVDNTKPTVVSNAFTFNSNGVGAETVTFTVSETLNGALTNNLAGFTIGGGTGTVAPVGVYSAGAGTVTLTNLGADGTWPSTITVSYNSGTGNMSDLLGNTMATIGATTVTVPSVTLQAGDIAFTSYGSKNTSGGPAEGFSFVILKNLPANTIIYFTANGWNGTALQTGEESITWTSPNSVTNAGTEVYFLSNSTLATNIASVGTGIQSAQLDLASAGDQVLAYQGSLGNPLQFIAAINVSSEATLGGDNWQTSGTVGTDANRSALPTGLTEGTNAVSLSLLNSSNVRDNVQYKLVATAGLTVVQEGSAQQLRTSMCTTANWNNQDNTTYSAGSVVYKIRPVITNVLIDDNTNYIISGTAYKAHITVHDDRGSAHTLLTSTIASSPTLTLSNLVRNSATSYDADFTVAASGPVIAAASTVATSVNLQSAQGNSTGAATIPVASSSAVAVYTTAITQANDPFDGVAPTISSITNTQSAIKAGTLTQTVTVVYSEPMKTSVQPTISLSGGSTHWGAQTFSGGTNGWTTTTLTNDTYKATFTHDGTQEEIASIQSSVAVGGAQDALGNSNTGSLSSTAFVLDTKLPTLAAANITLNKTSVNASNTGGGSNTIRVTVQYSEKMKNTVAPSVSFSSGTFGAGTPVTGGNSGWFTTAFTDDTYKIDFTNSTTNEEFTGVTASASGAQDFVGNGQSGSTASSATFAIDTKAPTVSSSNRVTTSPTNATSVQFLVTFSESVSGIDITDFVLANTGTVAGTISSVSVTSGSSVTVTINSITGDGTMALNVKTSAGGATLTDASSNVLTAGFTGGQTYTIDQTAPVVASIARTSTLKGIGTTNGIVATSVDFLVTFTETNTPLSGIDATDFTIISDGTVSFSTPVSISGSGNTRTVTISGITGSGRISLGVTDNNTILDAASNPLAGSSDGSFAAAYTGNQYYTIVPPEPNSSAFAVTDSNQTGNSITISWPSPNTAQIPTHFLVLAKPTSGAYPAVADGTFVSDAALVKNLTRVSGTNTWTFTGLNSGTSYDFTVYKYSLPTGVSNDNIDFETTAPGVKNGSFTTTASLSSMELTQGAVPISSLANSSGTGVDVMKFKIYDDGLDPLSPNLMALNLNFSLQETVTFSLRDQLTVNNGPLPVAAFTSSTGSVVSAVYSGKGTTNLVTLTSVSDGDWNSTTKISYSSTLGGLQFATLGKVPDIDQHVVTIGTLVTQTFNSSGSFPVPAGVTSLQVEVWGAGGSGGAYNTDFTTGGSSDGGGGGAYARSLISVIPSTNYPYTVGTGGAGVSPSPWSGSLPGTGPDFGINGGTTNFAGLVYAEGGQGGMPSLPNGCCGPFYNLSPVWNPNNSRGGSASAPTQGDVTHPGGYGGYGHNSNPAVAGSGGSSAGSNTFGASGQNGFGPAGGSIPGGIAPLGGGNGGAGVSNGGAGGAGQVPGGGGGGVGGPSLSGAGADGQVTITYYLPATGGTSDWAADDAPLKFSQLVITQGTGNSGLLANWQNIIAAGGAELSDGTNAIVGTVNPTNITFNVPFVASPTAGTSLGFIDDANGATSSKTYTLKVWLRNDLASTLAATVDGLNLDFKFDPTVATNLTYDDASNSGQKSSRIIGTHPAIATGAEQIQVVASKLVYHTAGTVATRTDTNPQSSIGVGIPFSANVAGQDPEVYALDANDNLDLNYSNSANITNPAQAFGQSVTSMNFSAGKLSLNPFFFTTGSASVANTQIVVTGTGSPTVTAGTSTNVASIISSLTTISSAGGAEPLTIQSTRTALTGAPAGQLNAVANFDFTITDDVGANATTFANNDALPTQFNTITITQGAGTDAVLQNNWDKVIAGAELTLSSTTGSQTGLPVAVTTQPNVTIGTNTITFSSIASSVGSPGYIDDNKANVYTLKIWLKKPVDPTLQDLIDNNGFEFVVDNAAFSPTGLTSVVTGPTITSGASNNKIDVDISQLDFTTQWLTSAIQSYDADLDADAGTIGAQSAVLKARDANQNLDRDYSGALALQTATPGTYPLVNHTGLSFATGQLTLTGLQVTSTGSGLNGGTTNLIATSGGFTSNNVANPFKGKDFILNYSALSKVIKDPSFTSGNTYASGNGYPENILYKDYQNAAFSANTDGVALERFILQDGGGSSDPDGTATTIQSITLNISNYQYLKTVALYDGATVITQKAVAGNVTNTGGVTGNITFTAPFTNPLTAGDNANNDFTVFVTFNQSSVVDNQIVEVRLNGVTAASVSSSMDPTGTTTTFAPLVAIEDENKIEVIATTFAYTNPNAASTASIDSDYNPNGSPVQLTALDINNNQDLDFTGVIRSVTNAAGVSMEGNSSIAIGTIGSGITYGTSAFVGGAFIFPTTFQFTTGVNGNNVALTVSAGANIPCDGVTNLCKTSPVISLVTSFESSLVFQDPTFTMNPRISYLPYYQPGNTTSLTIGNSYELVRSILVDGSRTGYAYTDPLSGVTRSLTTNTDEALDPVVNGDGDGASTQLTSLTIRVTRPSNLSKIQLFNNGTAIGTAIDVTALAIDEFTGSYDFVFTGSPILVASDNDEESLSVRVAFRNTSPLLTDQDNIQVDLIAAGLGVGSQFFTGGAIAGQPATTSPSFGTIDVIATKLDFTTPPGAFAGINEPISNGIVKARDASNLVDLDFNFSSTISAVSAGTSVTSAPFNNGILDLSTIGATGLRYSSVGNGTLTITANSLSTTTTPPFESTHVDAIDVFTTIATGGVVSSTNLAGGAVNKVIFGVTFNAPYRVGTDPYLNKFTITFSNPITGVLQNFRVFESLDNSFGGDIDIANVTIGGKVTQPTSKSLLIDFTQLGGIPRNLSSGGTGPVAARTYFLMIDVNSSANSATASIQPSVIDLGFSDVVTNNNIITSKGSTYSHNSSGAVGATTTAIPYTFAAIFPPTLTSSYPANGQLNVDPNQPTIDLVFSVPVWTLDNKISLYDKNTNTLVQTLTAMNGQYSGGNTANLSGTVASPLKFSLPALLPNHLYYITIDGAKFNGSTALDNVGIMDENANLFPGFNYSGTLYFKTANPVPPILLYNSGALPPSITNVTTTSAVINAYFDQKGTAYYMVVNQGNPAPTNAQIKSALSPAYAGTIVTRGSFAITQTNTISQFGVISPSIPMTTSTTYDVWVYAENDALPSHYATLSPYGGSGSNYIDGGTGPTLSFTTPATVSTSVSANNPVISLCTNSKQVLNAPIIISEGNKSNFTSSGVQTFNLLLPSGFEFDNSLTGTTPTYGSILLLGSDFVPNSGSLKFINNSILQVSYTNDGRGGVLTNPLNQSNDNIVIYGVRVLASSASNGDLVRLGGNALSTGVPDLTPVANLSATDAFPIDFTNSYSKNAFPLNAAPVTFVPDNYDDPNITSPLLVQLDALPLAGDFGPSSFNGTGVNINQLSLTAVTLGSPFNINVTHTDNNGCVSTNAIQYTVYDHTKAIGGLSTAYGVDPALFTTTDTKYIKYNNIVANYMLSMSADLPSTATDPTDGTKLSSDQIMFGTAWKAYVQTLPLAIAGNWVDASVVPNITQTSPHDPGNKPVPSQFYDDYKFDVNQILNAPTQSGGAILDPYTDNFLQRTPIQDNVYYTGGSLGLVEFTGTYQSIANSILQFPLKQNVEFFLPAGPIVEVDLSGKPFVDISDPQNPIGSGYSYPFTSTNSNKGTPIFCQQSGVINISGYPNAVTGISTGSFSLYDVTSNTLLLPTLAIPNPTLIVHGFVDNGNGTASIDPTKFSNGFKNIKVVYTYQLNSAPGNTKNSGSQIIRVSPNPVAKFLQQSDVTASIGGLGLYGGKASATGAYCEGIPIKFDPTSSTIAADNISDYTWNFGELTSKDVLSTSISPTIANKYDAIGAYTVTLKAKSDKGCGSINTDNTATITVGAIPLTDFNLVGTSKAQVIKFTDNSTASSGNNSFSKIASVNWAYGEGSPDALGSHQYTTPGHYTVTETVTTAIGSSITTMTKPGCIRSFDRHFVILDQEKITLQFKDDFESTSPYKWTVLKDSLYSNASASARPASWKKGPIVAGGRSTITSSPDGSLNVWATGLSGTYLDNERSFLYSPSFDMTTLQRPMVSFDANWDLVAGQDGVVLEYSTDDLNVADPNKSWSRVGDNTAGVNWLNGQLIASKPGKQISGDFGWTGTSKSATSSVTKNWVETKHELLASINGNVSIRKNVVFRFSFASSRVGGEGFAIDNFRIGERTRTVLIESFANTANTNANEQKVNKALMDFLPGSVGNEIVKVNYHVGFPGVDPFNIDNPADPSARSLYYNITSTPSSLLDGEKDVQDRLFSVWGQTSFDNRTLALSQADFSGTTAKTKPDGNVEVNVVVKATENLQTNTILHVGILEENVAASVFGNGVIKSGETNFEYVLKKMLPSAAGTKFSAVLLRNTSKNFGPFEWTPDIQKLYPTAGDLSVIVFLQNETTKEVYQSFMIRNIGDPVVITGLGDINVDEIQVYPNPSDRQFTIELPALSQRSIPIQMVDQMGRVIQTEVFAELQKTKTINTESWAEGLYIIQMGEGSTMVRKKVVITHK
jgi:hypothetical protein